MLTNYNNYGPFAVFAKNLSMTFNVSDLTTETWDSYFNGLLNMFRDGIETPEIQECAITLYFDKEDVSCDLYTPDVFFNLIMWYMIIRTHSRIEPKHIFFNENLTGNDIKNYIDKFFINKFKRVLPNIEMNNIIDDTLKYYSYVDEFAMYFANTINLEDNIALMKNNKEFYDILHADLSGVPIEDTKKVGMELTNKAINIMKNSRDILGYDHCLANSWRASEGINPRQYKEFSINIGSKPNGQGGVYPAIINRSFITGGANDPLSILIDSSTGRVAQILSKVNVGDSGSFARLLGLNNTDTILHKDLNYDCHTKNYQRIFVRDARVLKMIRDKYYKFDPDGVEYIVSDDDKHLIGQTILMRSPMTCLSKAKGHGICHKCYGDLAYINKDINIGKMAAESLSSKLTQILLSAKHLLETAVKKINWAEGFLDMFETDVNIIQLMQTDSNLKGYSLIIDPDNIYLENEDDYKKTDYEDDSEDPSESYNEYITEFVVQTPTGECISMHSLDYDKLYITNELNDTIRKKAVAIDGTINIPLATLIDIPLFLIIIHNNELSKTMDKIIDIIDKNAVTQSMDRHQLLQSFIESIIEGNLNVMSTHLEVILANQIRAADDILEMPDWSDVDAPYQILTLNKALTNHPSVVVSLLYQRLSKCLYNPLTFRKNKPSFMDLFFMDKPQEYLYNNDHIIEGIPGEENEKKIINPLNYIKPETDDEDDSIEDLDE